MSGSAVTTAAVDIARAAADAARITVRSLHDLDAMQAVVELFVEVWAAAETDPPMSRDVLRALEHAGSYVAAAYDGDELVGASAGFFALDGSLHSHITGVRAGVQGRGVGRALKLDQRAWCLARGVTAITWTFDPLIRRNGWFNLTTLGAWCDDYLVDFYGSMNDGVNGDDPSDRLFVRWDLAGDRAVAALEQGRPAPELVALRDAGARVLVDADDDGPVRRGGVDGAKGAALLVATPYDVVELRRRDREAAGAWRGIVRDALRPAIADGYRVTGMTRTGHYLLTMEDGRS